MSAIGLIILGVSRSVAIFLVDAGLLFEEFFARMSRLAIPAFAFLTLYAPSRHPLRLHLQHRFAVFHCRPLSYG
jgi:hypothetical protein